MDEGTLCPQWTLDSKSERQGFRSVFTMHGPRDLCQVPSALKPQVLFWREEIRPSFSHRYGKRNGESGYIAKTQWVMVILL